MTAFSFGNFVWFEGVVESILDPLMVGRVRVRVIGYHIDDKGEIPTDALPWASVVQPTTSSANSGIGHSPTGIVNGTTVFGFFRDGEDAQDPVVIGVIPGIPQEAANSGIGFNDPDGEYPRGDYIGRSDVNTLATGDAGPSVDVRLETDTGDYDVGSFTTPPTPYAAEYPFNKSFETTSGHVQEFDDTPGAERIATFHKSGSFEEIHPDGTIVRKIVADQFTVVVTDNNVLVKGSCNVSIEGDSNIKVGGDSNIKVVGDASLKIDGDSTREIIGDETVTILGNLTTTVTGDITTTCLANQTITTVGDYLCTAATETFIAARIDLNL